MCGWEEVTSFRFSVRFRSFTKLTAFSFFCSVRFGSVRPTFVCRRRRHLSFAPLLYDARNDVLPCWIGANCQPRWLRTRSAEIRHDEKILLLLILSCCKMNCEWDNVKNRPQTAEVGFWKPISDIFIGFRTPLNQSISCYTRWQHRHNTEDGIKTKQWKYREKTTRNAYKLLTEQISKVGPKSSFHIHIM